MNWADANGPSEGSIPLLLLLRRGRRAATVTEDALSVQLSDGRTVSAPLAWFPRLVHATPEERENWRLIGRGEGIHWPDLDEDISAESLIDGRPSGEGQESLKRWLERRARRQA